MNKVYDFIVIGAGISGCTFASLVNRKFPDSSILLVDNGRRIGGRSTSRKSRKFSNLEFDHGLPLISFSNKNSHELLTLISPLVRTGKLIDITSEILVINESGEIYNITTNQRIYRSYPLMINFCQEIIKQSINYKNINFLFQTCIKSIVRKNNLWEFKINNQSFLKSKKFVLSSSLIAHPRCLDILNINSLPLRDAFIEGKDKIVDSLLNKISKQKYLKRRNYILYISNTKIVKNFNHKYLYILFSKVIRDDTSFERIIFQRQLNGSMIIVLYCSYIDNLLEKKFDEIIRLIIKIFSKNKKFLDLFTHAKLLDKMDWRASEPIENLLPMELQWSSESHIGFCGDWFDLDGYTSLERAMNSSIQLVSLISRDL